MTLPFPYILAVAIAALAGGFRGFAGFGGGLLMVPLMSIVFPVQLVVPVVVLLNVFGDARLLPEVWPLVNRRRVLNLAVPALIAIPMGVVLLSEIPNDVLRRIVSVLVMGLAALMFWGVALPGANRRSVLAAVGAVSGLLTGVGGVGGPPVVLAMLSSNEPAKQVRANVIAYFATTGLFAFSMMALAGTAPLDEMLPLFALTAPAFIVTLHLGSKAFSRQEQNSYRRIALTFLVAVAMMGLFWPA